MAEDLTEKDRKDQKRSTPVKTEKDRAPFRGRSVPVRSGPDEKTPYRWPFMAQRNETESQRN